MKLEIYNYFPDTTPQAKFQGPMSIWVVWANSQCDASKSFCPFFSFLHHAHRSHLRTHPTLNQSLYGGAENAGQEKAGLELNGGVSVDL